jgi:glutaredoxin 3
MKRNIIIYGTKKCHWTDKIIHFLDDKGINKFKFLDVLKDMKSREEMVMKTGQYSTPVIEINSKLIIGYDREEIEKTLA